jgi:hypothetical protein
MRKKNPIPYVTLTLLLAAALVAGCGERQTAPTAVTSPALSVGNGVGHPAFGFNGTVSGFPTGVVNLTGGGAYDPATASNTVPTETFVHSAGGFSCIAAVAQGPLAGCAAGQGVRWDTAQLLASTGFKCTGADAAKTAVTGDKRVALLADFYRAGDGIDESFTARMIVSESDLAPEIPGVQNLWIEGVGCGTAIVHFN